MALRAIDSHVHPWDDVSLASMGGGRAGSMSSYFGRELPPVPMAEHPDLTLISAHPGWPWQDEQLVMARHKANVYFDLSGWAPKYFPPQLVQQVNRLIPDRVLFGSDWPVITPERWLAEFAELPIDPGVRQKILLDNAKLLFGLEA